MTELVICDSMVRYYYYGFQVYLFYRAVPHGWTLAVPLHSPAMEARSRCNPSPVHDSASVLQTQLPTSPASVVMVTLVMDIRVTVSFFAPLSAPLELFKTLAVDVTALVFMAASE